MDKEKHKLFITFETPFPEEGMRKELIKKGFIWENEMVRGVPFNIVIKARNIGTEKFSGGKLKSLKIIYRGYGVANPSMDLINLPDIPEIMPNEIKEIYSGTIVPVSEGHASIEMEMESFDGKPIEGYQNEEATSPVRINGWVNFFYVLRREDFIIMGHLSDISEYLKELLRRK